MQTLEYRTIDKSTWGAGPWQDEPDKMQYADPVTGLPCLIVRNSMGALCGYVGVSEGHPYYKKDGYSFDLDVHGGITFTNGCSPHETEETGICHIPGAGETDAVWWLGFDCNHHVDSRRAWKRVTVLMVASHRLCLTMTISTAIFLTSKRRLPTLHYNCLL